MNKFIYYLLVIFVSFEFLLIAIASFFAFVWTTPVVFIIKNINIAPEAMKYLSLFPCGLAVWVFNKSTNLLLPDKEKNKVFQEWEDYKNLKINFKVTLLYTLLFTAFAAIPWIFSVDIKNVVFFPFFISAIIGQLIVAYSVYMAQIEINERLAKL